jgi:hypothetical protein
MMPDSPVSTLLKGTYSRSGPIRPIFLQFGHESVTSLEDSNLELRSYTRECTPLSLHPSSLLMRKSLIRGRAAQFKELRTVNIVGERVTFPFYRLYCRLFTRVHSSYAINIRSIGHISKIRMLHE